MGSNRYIDHLREIALFRACNEKDLQRVARAVDEISVPQGRVLTQQGEGGREAFVIVEGSARVEIDGQLVATLEAGQQFGELSLLDGGPRTATVTADTEMTVLVISRPAFASLLDEVPGLARRIMASMAATIRQLELGMVH
jgi:CRP-like cAMP-binding protein